MLTNSACQQNSHDNVVFTRSRQKWIVKADLRYSYTQCEKNLYYLVYSLPSVRTENILHADCKNILVKLIIGLHQITRFDTQTLTGKI